MIQLIESSSAGFPEPPKEYLVWRNEKLDEFIKGGGEYDPEAIQVDDFSQLLEYYKAIIPDDLWPNYHIYLLKVKDYFDKFGLWGCKIYTI